MTLSSYSMLVPMFTKSLFSLDVLPLCQAFFLFFFPFFFLYLRALLDCTQIYASGVNSSTHACNFYYMSVLHLV